MRRYLIMFFVALGVSLYSQTIKNVTATEFKKEIETKKGILIDLRTPEEIATKGKIKGALEIDFLSKDAEKEISKLDKNKIYLVYCAGGGRSADCAELMVKDGFKEIINLDKGFGDWLKNGYEIEKQK